MNNNLLTQYDITNGGNGGGKVMSLLEETDAFISQEDAASTVDRSGIGIGGPTTMMKDSNATTTTHLCKRRVSEDTGDTTVTTTLKYASSGRSSSTNSTAGSCSTSTSSSSSTTAASDVATNAVTAFLQNQLPSRQPSEPEKLHRSKRQRQDDSQSSTLSPKTSQGLDSFHLDGSMKVSAASHGQEDDDMEPLPIFPQQPPFQQRQQYQQQQQQQQQQQPMTQQPRLPTLQQALQHQQGSPARARTMSLAERSFPSAVALAAASDSASLPARQPAPSTLPTTLNLHHICMVFAADKQVVEIALALDPSAIRRKADAAAKKASTVRAANSTWVLGNALQKCGLSKERYSYPINIAIQNKASMDVLELLVSYGKDVLVETDGYERTGSLSVAICHNPCDLDLIDLILFGNVQGIMVTDRKLNYPLHVACAKGASVDVIMRLYHHYPAALFQQNFNSETPLDICRRSSIMSEAALDFLLERFNEGSLQVAKQNYQSSCQQGLREILLTSSRAA